MDYDDIMWMKDSLNDLIQKSENPQEMHDFIQRELKNGTLFTP